MIVLTQGQCDWCGAPDARPIISGVEMCASCYPTNTGGKK